MTVVLVHGNPETPEVWDLLVPHLGDEQIIRLAPPGFGAPVPEGFGAHPLEYRSWLVRELEKIVEAHGPVDLVGHDWGGLHVVNVAMVRPDLLRSWACDVLGVFDPEYVWHELAQIWQKPGAGEEWIAAWLAAGPEGRAATLSGNGMNPAVAERIAPAIDATMGDCILTLYRAAAQPAMGEMGADLEKARARPGLALVAAEDHQVGTDEQRKRCADRAGARIEVLEGLGHFG
jgi:pimeloyl-ACP methyl ester carboxylesterase